MFCRGVSLGSFCFVHWLFILFSLLVVVCGASHAYLMQCLFLGFRRSQLVLVCFFVTSCLGNCARCRRLQGHRYSSWSKGQAPHLAQVPDSSWRLMKASHVDIKPFARTAFSNPNNARTPCAKSLLLLKAPFSTYLLTSLTQLWRPLIAPFIAKIELFGRKTPLDSIRKRQVNK
jgi:hypothetical protein